VRRGDVRHARRFEGGNKRLVLQWKVLRPPNDLKSATEEAKVR